MSDPEMGAYRTPEVGCFIKILKIQRFCCLITQLVKKLHQLALYEGIEDILLFVLNKKWSLSDILLLRYKQNSFGCFRNKQGIAETAKTNGPTCTTRVFKRYNNLRSTSQSTK